MALNGTVNIHIRARISSQMVSIYVWVDPMEVKNVQLIVPHLLHDLKKRVK